MGGVIDCVRERGVEGGKVTSKRERDGGTEGRERERREERG
jgi:hypothetical protein